MSGELRRPVPSADAPPPGGAYSQGIRVGDLGFDVEIDAVLWLGS